MTLIIAAVVTNIGDYFVNLFNYGIAPLLYGTAAFFFGLGCIGLMFPGQRGQEHAKENLYRVLGGLSLALLTAVIVGILQKAAGGPPTLPLSGTPTTTP